MRTRREFLKAAIAGGLVGGSHAAGSSAFAASTGTPCALPLLPQNEPQPYLRSFKLSVERARYRYNYGYLPGIPMVERVPLSHLPSLPWLTQVIGRVVNIGINARVVAGSDYATARSETLREVVDGFSRARSTRSAIARAVASAANIAGASDWPLTLADYAALFQTVPLPPVAADFADDRVFAWMRLAGPNPVVLRRITRPDERFPVTEAVYRSVVPDDSLAAAGAEARLYLADYAALEGVETGTIRGYPKYLSAPLALFAVTPRTRKLTPIAIQCGQAPGVNPLFTPRDEVAWLMAKTVVQVADANVHEAATHLARTHLLLEPFVIATERQLAWNHPVGILLRPHFEGTLFINDLAQSFLLAPGGPVDELLAGTLEATLQIAARGLADYSLNQAALPAALGARGVDDERALPSYPYRDDAILYWSEIKRWVHDYVNTYYRSSRDVLEDAELAKWCRELGTAGRVSEFRDGRTIRTRSALRDVLTTVIFTASVQHAAVNYPQYDHMAYMPNMPLAGFAPPPAAADGMSEQDYLEFLPPRASAMTQLGILYLLGSVRYTSLGEYGHETLCDPAIRRPMEDFRRGLRRAGRIVADRNRRRRPYPFLERGQIPQSTNI